MKYKSDNYKDQNDKDILRFITCGSVDDGKSTLIGRLLWDTKLIFDDHVEILKRDSKKTNSQSDNIDYALLLDSLKSERQQGITIDVAYRFFSTTKRKFIVADTPGHEQYTRNMITGASTANVAIILIDASKGILNQTKRHSFLVSLIGIKNIAVIINKMDLVDYNQKIFNLIATEYENNITNLGFEHVTYIPTSALKGDNIIDISNKTMWYHGMTLLDYLENVKIQDTYFKIPFRIRIKFVTLLESNFRGFCGRVDSGSIALKEKINITSSNQHSQVSRIVTMDGDLKKAVKGQSITICLKDEIDVCRGDIITSSDIKLEHNHQFQAKVVWLNEQDMIPGRNYLLKMGYVTSIVQIKEIKYKIDINTLHHISCKELKMNEIGVCDINVNQAISYNSYVDNPSTGNFILIDYFNNATIGAGMIDFPLQHSNNITVQQLSINKKHRSQIKNQTPKILWFTGLSGSGKSTISNLVEEKLYLSGKHTYLLDGDNIRNGLCKNLDFTYVDRVENIRRISEVAKLMVDAGLIVLTAFISPFRYERNFARKLFKKNEFIEIFINTPIEICESRDTKKLYEKARAGQIKNFTGIDSVYEIPIAPEIIINGSNTTPSEAADYIIAEGLKYGL